ncbi:MAG: amidase family protein, partial [Bellilinea sp.]
MELCDLPAYELSLLLRKKQTSSEEITLSCLQRIDAVDGRPGRLDAGELTPEDEHKVHAFITVTREHALSQARAVDQKLAAGEDPGPLAGIPFTAKDIFSVRGTLSTAGSRILANYTAPYTA